jgi:sugar/nucleoside kinase (ribokinase family)
VDDKAGRGSTDAGDIIVEVIGGVIGGGSIGNRGGGVVDSSSDSVDANAGRSGTDAGGVIGGGSIGGNVATAAARLGAVTATEWTTKQAEAALIPAT